MRVGTNAAAPLCGAAAAALYLSALTGSPAAAILVSLAQLPLFLAGLWLGTGAAVLAGLSAVGIVLVAARDVAAGALFAGLNAVPVVLLVRQALLARNAADGGVEWYPPGHLTAWLTGLALAAAALALAWFGGPLVVQGLLQRGLAPVMAQLIDAGAAEREVLSAALAALVPGILAASWMMLAIGNATLAQGVLARFGRNWRPSPQLAELRLPLWITALLGAAALAMLFGGAARLVGITTAIVLGIPYSLAGLAVLHAFAARLRHPLMPLAVFYVAAGLFGWPLLLVVLLGLVDVPLDLRRFAGRQASGGRIDG